MVVVEGNDRNVVEVVVVMKEEGIKTLRRENNKNEEDVEE